MKPVASLLGLLLMVVTMVRITEGAARRTACPVSCVLDMAAGHWLKERGGALAIVNPEDCAATCKDTCLMSQDPNKPNDINYICGPASLICNWREEKRCATHVQDSLTGESLEIVMLDIKERDSTAAGPTSPKRETLAPTTSDTRITTKKVEHTTRALISDFNSSPTPQQQFESDYNDTNCPKCKRPDLSKSECGEDKTLNETCMEGTKCYGFKLSRIITVQIDSSLTIELKEIMKCAAEKGCERDECTGYWWDASDPDGGYDVRTTGTAPVQPETTVSSTEEQTTDKQVATDKPVTTDKLDKPVKFASNCVPACDWCEAAVYKDSSKYTYKYGCAMYEECSDNSDRCVGTCDSYYKCEKKIHESMHGTDATGGPTTIEGSTKPKTTEKVTKPMASTGSRWDADNQNGRFDAPSTAALRTTEKQTTDKPVKIKFASNCVPACDWCEAAVYKDSSKYTYKYGCDMYEECSDNSDRCVGTCDSYYRCEKKIHESMHGTYATGGPTTIEGSTKPKTTEKVTKPKSTEKVTKPMATEGSPEPIVKEKPTEKAMESNILAVKDSSGSVITFSIITYLTVTVTLLL